MMSVTSIVLIFLELLRKSRPACHEKKFDRFFLFESSTYLVDRTENNQHDQNKIDMTWSRLTGTNISIRKNRFWKYVQNIHMKSSS